MMSATEIRRTTGGYINAIPLQDVPGVKEAYRALLDKVRQLAFVPGEWLDDVLKASEENQNRMWQPAYAIQKSAWDADKTSPMYPDIPGWLSSDPTAAAAWNRLVDWWTKQLQPILAGWARNEAQVMNAAANDAAFWDTLYSIVQPVASVGDAILSVPEVVGDAASKVGLGALKGLMPLIVVVAVIGVAVLVFKGKIAGK